MSVYGNHFLNEALQSNKSKEELQILLKKLKAKNLLIDGLINKRARIDLEIKRQKRSLKDLQDYTSKFKVSLKLESSNIQEIAFEHPSGPSTEELASLLQEDAILQRNIERLQVLENEGAFDYLP